MIVQTSQVDEFLGAALRQTPPQWPEQWEGQVARNRVLKRLLYHGIASLLFEKLGQSDHNWPDEVLARMRQQSVAQAMWEARHKVVLTELIGLLANHEVMPLILKGTAVAYQFYSNPGSRARGDTDLLIAHADLNQTRAVLNELGYERMSPAADQSVDFDLQEGWAFRCRDGTMHQIDLHWETMNVPVLRGLLSYADCIRSKCSLPRLCASAWSMGKVHLLIHTCAHRAAHIISPYIVDDVHYYGGDRLLWAHDIHLLATSLSDEEWAKLCVVSRQIGLAAVCLAGLKFAQKTHGTVVPESAAHALNVPPKSEIGSSYLLCSTQSQRAITDLLSIKGTRKRLKFFKARLLPPTTFVRGKYKRSKTFSDTALYFKRIVDLFRKRPSEF